MVARGVLARQYDYQLEGHHEINVGGANALLLHTGGQIAMAIRILMDLGKPDCSTTMCAGTLIRVSQTTDWSKLFKAEKVGNNSAR